MNVPPKRASLVALLLLLLGASPMGAFETVVIDPGHGGKDEGTAWYKVKEKATTLAVALRLEKLLLKHGIQCVLTRRNDTYVSLDDRVKVADSHPRSLLVSIHFNATSTPDASGYSTYYFPQSPSGRFVARTIQESLDESHSTPNRGIRPQNYAVLVRTLGCAVLVECGFLSNRAEARHFASEEGQQWLAEALLIGIIRAKPVEIIDPPETAIAKCEAYGQRLEEKEHRRQAPASKPAAEKATPKQPQTQAAPAAKPAKKPLKASPKKSPAKKDTKKAKR